jgi:hypothetical protein
MVGLEWSAVVNGRCGVIMRNRDVNYETAFNAIQACGAQELVRE